MKKKGNYDILSFKYPPFQAGAKQRGNGAGAARKRLRLLGGESIWIHSIRLGSSSANTANQISPRLPINTWFSRLKPVSLDFDRATAIIEAPNEFHKQTLLRCYSDLLGEAFQNVFGGGISFQICVHEELKPKQQEPDPFCRRTTS